MMVDIGNAIMERDNIYDIYKYEDIIYNIDISNENMLDFSKTQKEHKHFMKILKEIKYDKKINLEMIIKKDDQEDELNILFKSFYNVIFLLI